GTQHTGVTETGPRRPHTGRPACTTKHRHRFMRPLGSAKTCRSTGSACRSPISARASPPPARVATSAGAPASGEVLIVHALLNTDLTSRLINGDGACREVGAEQCRRYGLHGLALPAAAARHAGCFGRRNCNVDLDELRWDRP